MRRTVMESTRRIAEERTEDELASLRAKAEQLDELLEFQSKVEELNANIEAAAVKLAKAKDVAKDARAALDSANASLSRFIADWRKDGDRPLFRQNKPMPAEATWRLLSIAELDLSANAAANLGEAGIDTLGKLSDKMAEGERWWDDVQRIGEATAAKIADAMADFWAKHPEYKAKDEPITGKDAESDEPTVEGKDEEFPTTSSSTRTRTPNDSPRRHRDTEQRS